jgi:hypothetical protein
MALVLCRECGHQVSTGAKVCPNCGIRSPARVKRGVFWRVFRVVLSAAILLLVFAAIAIVRDLAKNDPGVLKGELPSCKGSTVTDLVKQAIEGSPQAKLVNVTVFSITQPEEVAAGEKRSCKAVALMNSGKREITYTVEWSSARHTDIWVQVQF